MMHELPAVTRTDVLWVVGFLLAMVIAIAVALYVAMPDSELLEKHWQQCQDEAQRRAIENNCSY